MRSNRSDLLPSLTSPSHKETIQLYWGWEVMDREERGEERKEKKTGPSALWSTNTHTDSHTHVIHRHWLLL